MTTKKEYKSSIVRSSEAVEGISAEEELVALLKEQIESQHKAIDLLKHIAHHQTTTNHHNHDMPS